MKRNVPLSPVRIALALATVAVLTTSGSMAQLRLGGSLHYGSEVDALGLQVNGYFPLTDVLEGKLSVGGDLTYFFPKTQEAFGIKSSVNYFSVNANGHYSIYESEPMSAYAVGGLNYTRVSVDVTGAGTLDRVSGSDAEMGLNLGVGGEYEVGFGHVFGELKYVLGSTDQIVLGAGVRIPVGGQ